jgi:hypothetical protein
MRKDTHFTPSAHTQFSASFDAVTAWEDQVLYFLLLDHFSDGNERGGHRDNDDLPVESGATPLYTPENSGRVDYDAWFRAGNTAATVSFVCSARPAPFGQAREPVRGGNREKRPMPQ